MVRAGELWRRIRSFLGAGRREPDLDQELRFHLEMETEHNRKKGMTPADAGRVAQRDFGAVSRVKEAARDARGFPRLSEWLRDLRFAMRSLGRSPGLTLVAVLTLSLGVGATTAIFSVVEVVLLRPLPFPHPERLAIPQSKNRNDPMGRTVTYRDFQAWQEAGVFDKVALFEDAGWDVAGEGSPLRAAVVIVTRDFFQVLGGAPLRGRFFVADDFTAGGARPVVLSYGFWQRLGARPDIVGSTIKVSGVTGIVAGIAARNEGWPTYADLWIPRTTPPDESDLSPDNYIYQAVARLDANSTYATVGERLDLLARDMERTFPVERKDITNIVTPAREFLVGPSLTRSLWVMLGAVGFVLLIACVNVANLLLARTTRRHAELSLRAALGAGRSRIARHLLSESLVLAVLGGAVGVVLAVLGVGALKRLAPPDLPGLADAAVNAPVLLVALGATIVSVFLAGLTPAMHGSGMVRTPLLGESTGRMTAGGSTGRIRSILVVAEVSLSLTLLAGAAILVRSFLQLQQARSGLDVASAITFQAAVPRAIRTDETVLRFWERYLERLRQIDGVEAASAGMSLPLGGGGYYVGRNLIEAGKPEPPAGPETDALWNIVAPGYFAALGQPILAGRDFTARDDTLGPKVLIVSQSFATAMFPKGSALGKRVSSWRDERIEREIVGIVGDVRYGGAADSLQPVVYAPLGETPVSTLAVIIRGRGTPANLIAKAKDELAAINPEIAMAGPRTLEEVRSASIARPRFFTLLIGVFSGTALLLAAVGLSGLLSYSVAQRNRELSIRMALGAPRGNILTLVLRQTFVMAGLGILLGLAGALALTRVLRSLLFEVSPTDPVAFASVAVLLLLTALLASALPARRAVRTDPVEAMRSN